MFFILLIPHFPCIFLFLRNEFVKLMIRHHCNRQETILTGMRMTINEITAKDACLSGKRLAIIRILFS